MGQQKLRKVRHINSNLKKIPTLNSDSVKYLPGPYNSYPKVARNQPKPRNSVIVRYLPNTPVVQTLSKNFGRPKAAHKQMPLKSAKARNQTISAGSSIIARSLPTFSDFEFKSYSKTKPVAVKATKFGNHPKSRELGTKKIPKGNSHKDLQSFQKKLQSVRRDEQKIINNSKRMPIGKPALVQSLSAQSKINRSAEFKRRDLIYKSNKIPTKCKSPDFYKPKILLPKQSIVSKNKQKRIRKVPESKSFNIQKRTDIDYPVQIGFREEWSLDPTEVYHSLPKLPGKLRSILKSSMNYSQIKKLDEDSLQHITEGKGPADECICDLLSDSESKGRGIKASIRRAFASFSGGKKRGGGGQNSADIPLSFTQGGKGGTYSTKEVLKRKSPCGKCGCDKGPVVLKHSYANIRITSPDLSTICPCSEDCFPDKEKYNGKIKVTVERMALNSDDSELSLHKRTQQLAIPEPVMIAAMDSLCPILAPGGDAQPANLHCRLCGATEKLHLITDDHVDQTLQSHFGITEPPTGFICKSCKSYLRITVGFSALVEASLNGTNSKSKELLENADIFTSTSSVHTTILAAPAQGKTNLTKPNQDILSLLTSAVKDQRKRRRRVINAKKSPAVIRKRVITECVQCGHKYPAMVKSESVLEYVCSRCNQKNQNKEGKNNGTLEVQKRCSLKGKTRPNCLSKTPQQVKPNIPSKTKLRNRKPSPKEGPKITHLRQVHKGGSVLAWDKKITDNLAGHGAKYGKYLEQHIKANRRSLTTHISRYEKNRLQSKNIWH